MKTKPDELELMKIAANHDGPYSSGCVRNPPINMPEKRYYFILKKWEKRGWFESGVSMRTGWLTPEGRAAISAIISTPESHHES